MPGDTPEKSAAQPRSRSRGRRRTSQGGGRKQNYAFIDSQNLNLGTQRVGWKMDWKKLREFLKTQYNVEKAYMFIGYLPDNEVLYTQMQDAGYLVVLKPTVDMYMTKEEIESESHTTKGNVDAELVLYAMKRLADYDKAIIVSGDGDFFCLAEYLTSQKKLLHIMTPNNRYSSLLNPFEQQIINLDDHRKALSYGSVRRPRRTPVRKTSNAASTSSSKNTPSKKSKKNSPASSAKRKPASR